MEKRVTFSSWTIGILFAVPQILLIFTFFYWPAGQAVYWSLTLQQPWGGGNIWVGLDNFRSILSSADYWNSITASLVFADDKELHALNNEWRGKDKPTNVLSFPMLEREELVALPTEGPPELLGDIALSLETCAREALEKGVPLEHHAAHLIVHGLLHLAGHDHELGEAEAEAMEALEVKALALIGVADPYGPRDEA